MLDIADPYTAYCFDEACVSFGSAVQSAMDNVDTKGKKAAAIRGARENAMRTYLGLPRKFADINMLRGREAREEPSFKME
jgi:hypothetical protein